MSEDILLVGAGGHSKVVLDALRMSRPDATVRLVDDDVHLHGSAQMGVTIESPGDWSSLPGSFHVCVGANDVRQKIVDALLRLGKRPISIIHPKAIISAQANVDNGAFVAAGAIVGPGASIGLAAIINHGAVVDHDCNIGAYAHLAPNATLGGSVIVGDATLIGSGAVVLPGLKIGKGCTVGAGAVVTNHVDEHQVVLGIPARRKT